jgi:hypothetical protein
MRKNIESAPQLLLVQKTRLPPHGQMIPINALAGELVAPKLYHPYEIHRDFLVSRRDARQKPFHWRAVCKCDVQLINELHISDDAVHGSHFEVVGPGGNKNCSSCFKDRVVFSDPCSVTPRSLSKLAICWMLPFAIIWTPKAGFDCL